MREPNTAAEVAMDPLMLALLAAAARLWVRHNPPPTTGQSCSTVANEFLWAAERAWREAAGA